MYLKTKCIIMFFLIVGYCQSVSSQDKIHTELYVSFDKCAKHDSITLYPLSTKIQQIINCDNYAKDTIQLSMENLSIPIQPFFFPKFKVFTYSINKKIEIDYTLTEPYLTFCLPDSCSTVSLEYEFQSELVLRSGFEIIYYLVPYIYSWTSWFFTCEDMCIDKVQFQLPEELYLFINLPVKEQHDRKITFSTGQMKNKDITFMTLKKDFYNYSSFKYKDILVDLYQTKGAISKPDSSEYIPDTIVDNKVFSLRQKKVMKAIRKINSLYPDHASMKISLIDKNLTARDKISWGFTFNSSENEKFILIDSNMWDDNSLYHELLHAFDRNGENMKKDSASFFFAESLIEYLSIYLCYDDPQEREKQFEYKILLYAKSKTTTSSVLGLEQNNRNVNNSGTAYIIYDKTPYLIHCFAKRIGEKRFIKAYYDFYLQALEKKEVRLEDFERVMKSHGVTNEEWEWFLWYL